jgi:hypothetical protein
MSDENTTPRRVAPEGPVPEDTVPEPEAAYNADGTEDMNDTHDTHDTHDTQDTVLLEQHPPTTELPSRSAAPSAEPVTWMAEPVASAVPSPAERAPSAGVTTPPGGLVTVRTGPRPGAIVLGLLCLLVAAYTMARQTTAWRFDLSLVGPISIGAFGTLLLLVGLVGLLSRRRS